MIAAGSIFDHPGFLILIVFIALVRWLMSKAKSQVQDGQSPMAPPPPAEPITRGGATPSEEERIRKFLEALGQPAGSAPPPTVIKRPRAPMPRIFPNLPPLTTVPPPLPAEESPHFAVPPPLPPQFPAPAQPDANYQVQEFARQSSSEPAPKPRASASLARIKLGTPQDLRSAIVLREIFGPPRSLQPLDVL